MQRSDFTEFSKTDFKEILSTCSSELAAAVQNGACFQNTISRHLQ